MRVFLILLLLPQLVMAQLSPAEYRRQVVEYSIDLKQLSNVRESAAEGIALARTGFLPSLSAEGSFKVHMRDLGWQDRWNYDLQPTIIQKIYSGGALSAAYDKAIISEGVALCNEEFAELEICYAADYAYWNLLSMESLMHTMRDYVGIISSLQESIKLRFEDGYTAKGDLLMISSRLSEAEYELLAAERSYEVAQHNFNILRGEDPSRRVTLPDIDVDNIKVPSRVGRSVLLDSRPDLRAVELNAEAAAANVRSARASYNPQINALAYGYMGREAASLGGDSFVNGTVQLQLTIPIYHFGARRRSVAMAQLSERNSRLDIRSAEDAIILEESNGWSGVQESELQLLSAREALALAVENLDISTYSYQEGLTTILDAMQAQLSWIQIYTNSISAEFDYLLSISAYNRTVGRNFVEK